MHAYDIDADPRTQDTEKLKKAQKRYTELRQQIEDRNIENLADLAEMQYLEYEMKETLERLKIEAINRHNQQLETWRRNKPAPRFVGYKAEDIHESEYICPKTPGSDGYE